MVKNYLYNMSIKPIRTNEPSPKFLLLVFEALNESQNQCQSGSSAKDISQQISKNYKVGTAPNLLLQHVQSALEKALCQGIVKQDRQKNYVLVGPVADYMANYSSEVSVKQSKHHKKIKPRVSKKRKKKFNIVKMKPQKRKGYNLRRKFMLDKTKLVKCPECSKLLTIKKVRSNKC